MDYGKSNVHSRVPMTLVHWLDDVGANCQVQLTEPRIFLEPNQMSSVLVSLSCSGREEHHSPISRIQT